MNQVYRILTHLFCFTFAAVLFVPAVLLRWWSLASHYFTSLYSFAVMGLYCLFGRDPFGVVKSCHPTKG